MVKNDLKKIILAVFTIIILGLLFYFNVIVGAINELKILGISENIILAIFSISIVSCLIAFARHIIGLNIPNFYLPLTLVFSISILGFLPTMVILTSSLLLSILTQFILKNYSLQLASKNSLLLGTISIALLLALPALIKIQLFNFESFQSFIFIFFATILLIGKSINNQPKFNLKKTIAYPVKMLLFSIFCLYLIGGNIDFDSFQIQNLFMKNLISQHADLIFLSSFIINVVIGQYTGLRLNEVIRFRALISKK